MAKITRKTERPANNPSKRVTSIGNSVNTRPKNKRKRQGFKKSRGQGR